MLSGSLRWRFALLAVLCAGCATAPKVTPLEQAGNEMGKGFLMAVEKDGPKTVDVLMKSAADGLRGEVLTDETNVLLQRTLAALGEQARAELPGLREEVMGPKTEAQLQAILLTLMATLEARSRRTVRGMMDEVGTGVADDVLSGDTERRLNEIMLSLGETARGETRRFRDEMLSAETDQQMRMIVATAMDEVVLASERIRQKAHDELSFVQKNANWTIVLAGALGAVIAFFMWRQKEKNRVLLNLLMAQVHASSSDREEEIMAKVAEQAQQFGISGPFRSALANQGRAPADRPQG